MDKHTHDTTTRQARPWACMGRILAAGVLLLAASCAGSDEERGSSVRHDSQEDGVAMALSLHSGTSVQKMTTANTQANEVFSGMDSIILLPFGSTTSGDETVVSPVRTTDESLGSVISLEYLDGYRGDYIPNDWDGSHTFAGSQSRVYPRVKIPTDTRSFLAYGIRPRGGNSVQDKFQKGSTTISGVNYGLEETTTAGGIQFSPEPIYKSSTMDWTKANAIISYLNTIIGTTYSNTRRSYVGVRTRYNSGSYSFTTNTRNNQSVSLAWSSTTATTGNYTSGGNSYYYKYEVPDGLKTARTNFINSLSEVACTSENIKNALNTLLTAIKDNYTATTVGFSPATASYTSYYNQNNENNYNHSANQNYDIYNQLMEAIRTNIRSTGTVGTSLNSSNSGVSQLGASVSNFPENLPDGLAVIHWNGTAFELKTCDNADLTTTISEPTRYVYPAQLWYRSNTLIKTSEDDAFDENMWVSLYGSYSKWAAGEGGVLSDATWTGTQVKRKTTGVALVKPMGYGVARLELKVKGGAASSLVDNDGYAHAWGSGSTSFPLTGVIISNQRRVGYDFLPSSALQYLLYDRDMNANDMYLRQNTETTAANHTLVLPSGKDDPVRLILEFQNNSENTITGYDITVGTKCRIPKGSKFYLMGEIDPKTKQPYPTDKLGEEINNVFHPGYVTTITATVNDLKEAYNIVPDVSNPTLIMSLRLDLKWRQVTPSELELE
ncbi:MAG: hypothetical protein ILA34_02875 [Bacteroidaceae bacterium]|nr:hypothetical protein [Bacteroidaceae bacterium]